MSRLSVAALPPGSRLQMFNKMVRFTMFNKMVRFTMFNKMVRFTMFNTPYDGDFGEF
jgi:putative transposase